MFVKNLQLIKNGKKVAIFKRSQNVDPYFEDKVLFYTGDRNEITDLENAINEFKPEIDFDLVTNFDVFCSFLTY